MMGGLGRRRHFPGLVITVMLFGLTGQVNRACAAQGPKVSAPEAPAVRSFAVYALSRGSGVPKEAYRALRLAEAVINADRDRGLMVDVSETRLGIEGETRLCAEYEDSRAAEAAFGRIREIVKDVDLVDVVQEPCKPSPQQSKPNGR